MKKKEYNKVSEFRKNIGDLLLMKLRGDDASFGEVTGFHSDGVRLFRDKYQSTKRDSVITKRYSKEDFALVEYLYRRLKRFALDWK